jgi:hypothetical protein
MLIPELTEYNLISNPNPFFIQYSSCPLGTDGVIEEGDK